MDALPTWNLGDLYSAPEDARLAKDQNDITDAISQFATDYRGKITTIPPLELATAIKRFENLEDRLGKISSYADLLFSTDTITPAIVSATQNLQEFVNDQSAELVFFTLELNQIDDEPLQEACASEPALQHYQPWLRDVRSFRPHQLEESLERLLLDKSITSEAAWIRLYEDSCNRMPIHVAGQNLTLTEALDLLSDTDGSTRKQAALALSQSFEERAEQFGLIFNTVIKDKAINDKWRGFEQPVSSRNLANLVEDDIVDTLAQTVTTQFSSLSERYYRVKAKMMGKDHLDYWDRNAPLPGDKDALIPWQEAKEIVLGAYHQFSPEMALIAEDFFTKGWIDAPLKTGKTSGAFSHPTVPSAHPYILMNYQGKVRDVMTLAHELGHGVHQVLSCTQGALMADTPLTLAETASVFGEQLTFQYLLAKENDTAGKKRLIAGKVEDMLNTVVRQIAFYNFETALHRDRKHGELSVDAINHHWMETQRASFGSSIHLDESYRFYWTYVSHFYHAPFYVYAYAFGDCLVNSLYALYQEEREAGRGATFEANYMEMLRSGGRHRHKELLAPFGIDIAKPDFWQKGLNHIARHIDFLETM